MNTKIIMPVIDTERGKFEYKGRNLTREDISNMEYDKFLRTNGQVRQFTDNIRRGISNFESGFSSRLKDYKDKNYPDILYNAEEVEAIILDSKKNIVESKYFEKFVENGKMFIALVNFNPNKMSPDAQSEMLYWMKDSKLVLDDMSITEELKLKTLPTRFFWVDDGDKHILFAGCKIVQIYANKKNPFYIGIIVEKATYDDGK